MDTKDYKELDEKELDAFLAILIASGVTQLSKVPFKMLWKDTQYVPSIFSGIMNRFVIYCFITHLSPCSTGNNSFFIETEQFKL